MGRFQRVNIFYDMGELRRLLNVPSLDKWLADKFIQDQRLKTTDFYVMLYSDYTYSQDSTGFLQNLIELDLDLYEVTYIEVTHEDCPSEDNMRIRVIGVAQDEETVNLIKLLYPKLIRGIYTDHAAAQA